MGPDLELKGSYISQEALGSKQSVGLMKEPKSSPMKCASNYEDTSFGKEEAHQQAEGNHRNPEMEVDILEDEKSGDIKSIEMEQWDPDLTESSSSFDSTDSRGENGASLSDDGVDSEFDGNDLSALSLDCYSGLSRMRKKKLKSNWRKCIGPLMWRCKWIELQIKKLEFQAQKYDKEIAEYYESRHLEDHISEDVCSKSLTFSSANHNRRKAVMKRKKRKRVEDTEEMASYMSHHSLFSYFENKRPAAKVAFADGTWGNQEKASNSTNENGVDEELLSLEFKAGNDLLEHIFWKIGVVQCQVSEMKTRVRKVLSENAMKLCSTENLNLLVSCNNTLMGPAQNPVSPPSNDDRVAAPSSTSIQSGQDYDDSKMGDVVMPECAASRGELNYVPETVKCTKQPAFGGSSRNPSGGILIYSRRAKKDLNKPKEANVKPSQEQPRLLNEEQQQESCIIHSSQSPPKPQTPKFRSISKMTTTTITAAAAATAPTTGTNSFKRKRATRKAGSGKWNR